MSEKGEEGAGEVVRGLGVLLWEVCWMIVTVVLILIVNMAVVG